MQSQTVSNWVQVIASIAVVAGLVLVLIELRQSKSLAEAQFSVDGFMHAGQLDLTLIGEEGAESYRRACFEPETLTDKDAIVLTLIFENLYQQVWSMKINAELADTSAPWSAAGAGSLRRIFNTGFGRAWWDQSLGFRDPAIVELGDKVLAAMEDHNCAGRINDLISRMKAAGTP